MKERPSALVTVMRVLMGSMRARSLEIDHDIRGNEFVIVVPCYMRFGQMFHIWFMWLKSNNHCTAGC